MKKYIHFSLIAVVLLLSASLLASAAPTGIYVNDGQSPLSQSSGNVWVLGSGGSFPMSLSGAEVLSASGYSTLSSFADSVPGSAGSSVSSSGNIGGGGGLRYEDGYVTLPVSRLLVGLRYYYSDRRDSSLSQATLENASGQGFEFGWLDSQRRFNSAGAGAETPESRILLRPGIGGSVEVYSEGGQQLLWTSTATGKTDYFAVRPVSQGAFSVCLFSGSRYTGDFAFADLGNGKLTVVNAVDVEHYVIGVCDGEMGASFPLEALKAQAVAARTYAMYNARSGSYLSACGFDLTGDDYSQVYMGYTEDANLTAAAYQTENQYLTYRDSLIDALFFAADGGATLNSEEVFSSALPYLRGYDDPYEASAWTRGAYGHRVGMSQWGAYAMAKYYNFNYKDILGFYYTGVGLSYGY